MKKFLSIIMVLLATLAAKAETDSYLSVKEVNLPLTTSASIEIALINPTEQYGGFTFSIALPEGVECVLDNNGYPSFTKGTRLADKAPLSGYDVETHLPTYTLLATGTAISGTSGVLLIPEIKLTSNSILQAGDEVTGTITDIMFTDQETADPVYLEDVNFTITVSDRTVLDENSVTMPLASGEEEVNILVKRTIKANEWSTICLPFDMTEDQLKAAFGDDVELAVFHSYEKGNTGDDVTELTVYFDDANIAEYGLYANYPYIIRTSKDITTFEVTAEIDPDEKGAIAKYEVKQGPKTEVHGTLQGTLHAGDAIPADCLFLNGNKFWHSTGATTIKAFRAYFWFKDVISSGGEAKLRLIVNDEVVAIEGVGASSIVKGAVYNVNGQLIGTDIDINSLPKGVYMVDGKKVMNY